MVYNFIQFISMTLSLKVPNCVRLNPLHLPHAPPLPPLSQENLKFLLLNHSTTQGVKVINLRGPAGGGEGIHLMLTERTGTYWTSDADPFM